MCLDLERWGACEEIADAVNRAEAERETAVRSLLDGVATDVAGPREPAPAAG